MPSFQFSDTPDTRHQVLARADAVQVDGTKVPVRGTSDGGFVASVDGRSERLYAVAHGDTIHVQLRGRAWKIDRVDPTRPAPSSGAAGAGASHAPMPGVVVSLLVGAGQAVARDEALMVIESMKLQMTISAALDGQVAELPLTVGQTFQRGDLLVRVQATGDAA